MRFQCYVVNIACTEIYVDPPTQFFKKLLNHYRQCYTENKAWGQDG